MTHKAFLRVFARTIMDWISLEQDVVLHWLSQEIEHEVVRLTLTRMMLRKHGLIK